VTLGETTEAFSRRCRHCGEPLDAVSSFCSKCGATADLKAGKSNPLREQLEKLFGQDLDIEREIGRGGMAAVFAGFDPALQRRVAIKVLLPEIANDRSSADRFLREARTVASLQHPHVVTVYAVKSRDGVHAIVMQFVEGRSLDATLLERGSLTLPVAGMLLAHSCDGLQHAHERGVIHRDVKPANVLIEQDGRAIVSDFGIARRDSGPRTTDTGLVVGTWAYMSPEQRSADSITPATDQYALGVMAFELLTGRLPFTGSPSEMMQGHMHSPPPSLRAIRPNISEQLEAVIHRMLAKDPAQRFPSLREPEKAFRALIANEGQTTLQLAAYSKVQKGASQVVAAVPSRSAVQSAQTQRMAESPMERAELAPTVAARPRRNNGALIGAGVGVAVLAAAWFALNPGAKSASPVTAPVLPAPPAQSSPANAPATQTQPANTVTNQPAEKGSPRGATDPKVSQPIGGGAVAARPLAAPQGETQQPRANVSTLPAAEAPPTERPAPTRADPPPAAAAPALPAATRADAQRLAREFVTMVNQRRFRELGQIPNAGGDATSRAELLRVAETAADLSAGFDRVASTPQMSPQGFETDFDVDLQWRGGRRVLRVLLYAVPADGGWKVAGVAISPAG
jgi:tRNA A-37 threonylcarbamoyl transferase component Bud32